MLKSEYSNSNDYDDLSDDVLDTQYGLVTLWIIEVSERWGNYLRNTIRNTTV
jgi:hypothetical protein